MKRDKRYFSLDNLKEVMRICKRIYVQDNGHPRHGETQELKNEEVKEPT